MFFQSIFQTFFLINEFGLIKYKCYFYQSFFEQTLSQKSTIIGINRQSAKTLHFNQNSYKIIVQQNLNKL